MGNQERKRLRWVLKLAGVLVVAGLLLEASVRIVLFAEVADGSRLARALRVPLRYADRSTDHYWRLQSQLVLTEERRQVPGYDELLGWRGNRLTAGDYQHPNQELLNGRRPLLLYGDSYSACATLPKDCFEARLESSSLSDQFCLLNYGIGGYGLDQTYLLLANSIDLHVEQSPIVLVGLLIDDDLDRCELGFRCWPKPRFTLRDGELELDQPRVPEQADYFAAHPDLWTSYALSFLARRTGLAPREVHAADEPRALAARLLESIVHELASRDLPYLFVVFHGEHSVEDPARLGWRAEVVGETLDRLGAPWVATREGVLADAAATGRSVHDYYGHAGKLNGHLNALGNRVAFATILDGLARFHGIEEPWPGLSPADIARVVTHGESALARHEFGTQPPFETAEDLARLSMRIGAEGPTELHYDLSGGVRAFTAIARVRQPADQRVVGSVRLTLLADGAVVYEQDFRGSDPRRPLRVELDGVRKFTIRADDAGDGNAGDWLILARPVFE